MNDPLSQFINLLQPRAVLSSIISAAGPWAVRYTDLGHPSFGVVLEGSCRLAIDGMEPMALQAGDFLLLPSTPGFVMSGFEPVTPELIDAHAISDSMDEVRYGLPGVPPDVRMLGSRFVFDSLNAGLLISLLPTMVLMRGIERLSVLAKLVSEESVERRLGRDLVLTRLVEVLLIEALRCASSEQASPGLLRGLADPRIASSIRQMHAEAEHPWTMAQLAKHASLSRSAFFERFTRVVGVQPMEYLLAWRMALAKDLLQRHDMAIAEVAERVGYSSASSFSTAFSRYVGQPPSHFARASR